MESGLVTAVALPAVAVVVVALAAVAVVVVSVVSVSCRAFISAVVTATDAAAARFAEYTRSARSVA